MTEDEPAVKINLSKIYDQVQTTDKKVDELATAIGELVAVNRRLDSHHQKLSKHDDRLDILEQHKAVIEARPRAPWWVVVSAVGTILTGVIALTVLLKLGG